MDGGFLFYIRTPGRVMLIEYSYHSKKHKAMLTEEFRTTGDELVKKVKELVRQGNIRRIIVKNEQGQTLVEIPVTVATVGALLAPPLAALGAIAALVANCTIVVEKRDG